MNSCPISSRISGTSSGVRWSRWRCGCGRATLEEFAGQEHFLGEGKLLRRMLQADRLTSVIFYGPPGTGKTTLAEVIANHTNRHFERANAAMVGVKEIRQILDEAAYRLESSGKRTILFLDEIHRFAQISRMCCSAMWKPGLITADRRDDGESVLRGQQPLVSRSTIFRFEPLSEEEISNVIRRAVKDRARVLGRSTLSCTMMR